MFASVLRLRKMGVRLKGDLPPEQAWATGILEMSGDGFGGQRVPRRLVLRDARANPERGLLFELFQPTLVDVKHPYLKFRGIEGVSLGVGEVGGVVQEWLVRLR